MRAVIVAVFLIGAFIAGAFVTGVNPAAAERQSKKDQWQYQCFEADGVAQVTDLSNKMGVEGWEMVTSAGSVKGVTLWCFKRPLWKSTK